MTALSEFRATEVLYRACTDEAHLCPCTWPSLLWLWVCHHLPDSCPRTLPPCEHWVLTLLTDSNRPPFSCEQFQFPTLYFLDIPLIFIFNNSSSFLVFLATSSFLSCPLQRNSLKWLSVLAISNSLSPISSWTFEGFFPLYPTSLYLWRCHWLTHC